MFCYRLFYLSEPNLRHAPTQTGEIVMDIRGIRVIYKHVLVFGEPSPIFRGQKPETLQWGLWGFSPSPYSDMRKGRSGKLLQIYVECRLA